MSTVRRSHHSQSGFSLAEVFVATAIFAVIFIAALLVYDRSNKVFKSGLEAADLQQNTRVAFDKVLADVRLAGFDFDRDGVPTFAGQAQQPDEQLEYAGPGAITIRSNFNYTGDKQGRIPLLEHPTHSQFPNVTTGNDEIVTYALVPDTPGAVVENLTFYADVSDGTAEARQSYPGGEKEDVVTITGVDLCDDDKNGDGIIACEQPPYTLYRFTVKPDGGVERTPLANNIRSVKFQYYNDIAAASPLTITDPGGGRYDPADAATLNAAGRTQRAQVRSIRVSLVGLNQSDDSGWTQQGESIASVQKRRQYTLESMVVPRNLGKRGMKEQQTLAPGKPVLDMVCFNYCGLAEVKWTAPSASGGTGEVETYHVLWDNDIAKSMASPPQESRSAGLGTSFFVTGLDPGAEYRFSVAATNSYGTTYADNLVIGQPLNGTTPAAPTLTSVTSGGSADKNQIKLNWTLPTTNVVGTASCKTPAGAITTPTAIPQASEMQGIEIWRGTSITFDPDTPSTSTVKVATATASSLTYSDHTAANCKNYFYRIRVLEYCGIDPNKNLPSIIGRSAYDPPVGSNARPGDSVATHDPSQPGQLDVVNGSGSCTGVGTSTTCDVTVKWPQVMSDVGGNTIAIDTYEITSDNGTTKTTQTVSASSGDYTVTGGVVTAVVKNLLKYSPSSVAYTYQISVKAVQCTIMKSVASLPDVWPDCTFGGGELLSIGMSGLNDGTGTAADPFQILGAESITFSLPSQKILRAEASVYNAATGALVEALTPQNGTSNSLSLAWPDLSDNTNYRVDYTLYDGSSPQCTEHGYFYVRETMVGCPFATITPIYKTLDNGSSDRPYIQFPLKNTTTFDVTFVKATVTWNEDLAHPSRGVTISPVSLPASAGGTVNASLTSISPTGTGGYTKPNGIGIFEASTSAAAKLFDSDTTGNYKMKFTFTITGNKNLCNSTTTCGSSPITDVVIYYLLPGDAVSEVRNCDVF